MIRCGTIEIYSCPCSTCCFRLESSTENSDRGVLATKDQTTQSSATTHTQTQTTANAVSLAQLNLDYIALIPVDSFSFTCLPLPTFLSFSCCHRARLLHISLSRRLLLLLTTRRTCPLYRQHYHCTHNHNHLLFPDHITPLDQLTVASTSSSDCHLSNSPSFLPLSLSLLSHIIVWLP
jgi:uncharacterized ParB-like nuclease family protein